MSSTGLRPFVLALLVAGTAHAQGFELDAPPSRPSTHLLVSFGAGGAYSLAGVSIAAHLGQLEPFVGLGVGTFVGGVMGGVRFVFHDEGGGPFLSLQGGRVFGGVDDEELPSQMFSASLIAGYRFDLGPRAFAQLGLGPALVIGEWDGPTNGNQARPLLDADVGFGVRF